MGLVMAAAGAIAGSAVPIFYRFYLLGPHQVAPLGLVTPTLWSHELPEALLLHLVMAGPPVLSLLIFRRHVAGVLWGALASYLLLLLVMAAHLAHLTEPRTYWVAVPAFAAGLALWRGQSARDVGA